MCLFPAPKIETRSPLLLNAISDFPVVAPNSEPLSSVTFLSKSNFEIIEPPKL